ncbi:unnamed protein product [Rotaria sp. Silwood2]|nr:unnamed protein product [Rotaria sp. Silwood2]
MNGDTDETNNNEHCSSSNNTTSPSSNTPQNQQIITLTSSFFNEDTIVTQNNMNTTINNTSEENLLTIPNHNEENPINKSFKRKVVSFSAMPFEKKVADGNIEHINDFLVMECQIELNFLLFDREESYFFCPEKCFSL